MYFKSGNYIYKQALLGIMTTIHQEGEQVEAWARRKSGTAFYERSFEGCGVFFSQQLKKGVYQKPKIKVGHGLIKIDLMDRSCLVYKEYNLDTILMD